MQNAHQNATSLLSSPQWLPIILNTLNFYHGLKGPNTIWPQLIFHYSPLPSSCPLDTLASLLSQNMPSTFLLPSLYPCCVLHLRLSFTKYPPGSLYSKITVRGHLSCPFPHLKYFTTFSKSIFTSSTENHLYSTTFLFVCHPLNASLFN